jgi:ABC-type siderophore export system fused ATPase/permease subunit
MVRRIVTIATTAMLVVFMAKSLTLMVKLRETQDELDSTKTKLEQVEQELEIERNRELQVKTIRYQSGICSRSR